MKNIVLKSFETFVTQPLSILCSKIIRLTNLKTDFLNNKSINVEILDDAIQVNVVNSESAYNLLSAVVYKKKMQALRRNSVQNLGLTSPFGDDFKKFGNTVIENKTRTIFNQLPQS